MSLTPMALAQSPNSSQALVAVPQIASPSVVTTGNQSAQNILLQAVLGNMKDPNQAQQLQAALAVAARQAANSYYLDATIRKLAPALTNGAVSQAYALNTPLTFNMTTAINGFCEGLLIRYVVNYTLAAGTSAVYGLTAAGALGLIDTIEVRYNKSQHKIRLQAFRELALLGALEDYSIPSTIIAGQSISSIQSYLYNGMPVSVGANQVVMELFIPFCLLGYNDPRGLLPIIVGDTGIQVLVNTPLAILGSDPILNSLYPVSGSGHAVTAVSGTVQVSAVYRDGDQWMNSAKVPFDLSSVQGTFQMQIDTPLLPLLANNYQRQKLTIMGQHYYVLLFVVDGLQSNVYAQNSNLLYIERAKDGVGGNVFDRYGLQTNLTINDFLYVDQRLDAKQDLDQGCIPIINGPTLRQGDPHIRRGVQYLDNSRTGWPDWRYCVTPSSVGSGTLNGFPCQPRIEPHVFYINPTGLIPV